MPDRFGKEARIAERTIEIDEEARGAGVDQRGVERSRECLGHRQRTHVVALVRVQQRFRHAEQRRQGCNHPTVRTRRRP